MKKEKFLEGAKVTKDNQVFSGSENINNHKSNGNQAQSGTKERR
jgi:hypothetical protein